MATFTNRATLSYRGNVVNSNTVTGEIVQALSIEKNSLLPYYEPDGCIVYVVTFTNSGGVGLNDIRFTDDLGAYQFGAGTLTPLTYVDGSLRYYSDGVLQATPTVESTEPLEVRGLNLAPGSDGLLIYQVRVNEYAPLASDSTVTNTATVTSGDDREQVSDSATVSVRSSSVLDINKAISPDTVSEGGRINYTFTIFNYGNTATVATDDVIVTDIFSPILRDITVTYNGTPWTEGDQYTYDEATGRFETAIGAILVDAATYTQDPASGVWSIAPGTVTLTVSGNLA